MKTYKYFYLTITILVSAITTFAQFDKNIYKQFLNDNNNLTTQQLFGLYVDTYIINVIVLWIMTIILYLILYFRLLKKLLDSGEVLMGKKLKGSD